MSAKNEMRERVAYVLLATGASLYVLGLFAGNGALGVFRAIGIALFGFGFAMFISLSVINGVPWLVRLISRQAEPEWDGEILYTDGGRDKVRYLFDDPDCIRFVASDVCVAIGVKPPHRDALKWGGASLTVQGENLCFSESSIQDFLTSFSVHNPDAARLLVIVRNSVLRKLEKQRDQNKIFGEKL